MKTNLREYFPMIRTREEILTDIQSNPLLANQFYSMPSEWQDEILDACSGNKGVKLLYDVFFKEVMNPEYVPERLNELLTLILGRKVEVVEVLQNDSSRIADEASLLIMDIVVKLEDGSIANIEVQKIGYKFLGQRAACYSADLLLRQLKRVRSKMGKRFTYSAINNVYTIIFFDDSPRELRTCPEQYFYKSSQQFNADIDLKMLQHFFFISLDNFRIHYQNKGITNDLDAWMLFLSSDKPEDIIKLIIEYPKFKTMYHDIYNICRNMENVMGLFSEELAILDRNTVKLMVEEMQDELDAKKEELNDVNMKLDDANMKLDNTKTELDSTKTELDSAKAEILALQKKIAEMERN